MTNNYYSTIEVGKILHISRVAVLKRIKSGKLKAERVGKNFIISNEAVMEALGKSIGKEKKEKIEHAVKKAVEQYEKTFKLLGRE
ncbi:MAG: excisionase family DNA-binding protein [Candidatus Azambacteria bacterium]|nr:excisionase family DNA-binding protein [Candidatus Azambacteria bacterium]